MVESAVISQADGSDAAAKAEWTASWAEALGAVLSAARVPDWNCLWAHLAWKSRLAADEAARDLALFRHRAVVGKVEPLHVQTEGL